MILETFLLKNVNIVEKFENNTDKTAGAIFIGVIVLVIVLSIFYIGGAISLSLNYNNYIGTNNGLRIFYAILVLFFPSLYYPFYAWFLSPVSKVRARNTTI